MVTVEEFVKRSKKLESFLLTKVPELLMKHESDIVKLSNEQLMQGINVNSKLMQRGYSPQYSKKRKKSGLQTAHVDLRFTGKYQDTKKAVKTKEGIDIKSGVEYEKYLRGNFPDHVGLTKQNAKIVSEMIAEDLVKIIDKYYS